MLRFLILLSADSRGERKSKFKSNQVFCTDGEDVADISRGCKCNSCRFQRNSFCVCIDNFFCSICPFGDDDKIKYMIRCLQLLLTTHLPCLIMKIIFYVGSVINSSQYSYMKMVKQLASWFQPKEKKSCCARDATHVDRPSRKNSQTEPSYSQGLKFRRNFAEIRRKISFSLLTGKKNFGIFQKISFENSKFKKIRPKVTEIRRNLPKFRNEISFPLNTGICNENEMVNPGYS